MTLHTYLPQDRLRALARGETLPDRTTGSALFADISGFTALTEGLRESLGARQGAEELTKHLGTVYTALIAEVEKYGGSVIGFAGDAITCWFDDAHGPAAPRATSFAFALQEVMLSFTAITLPNGSTTALTLKVALATGPARRFVVGDPTINYLDALAGATIARTSTAEHLANKGDILLDEATVNILGSALTVKEWRTDAEIRERFAVVGKSDWQSDLSSAMPATTRPLASNKLQVWIHNIVYEREISGQESFLTEFRPCVALFVRFMGIDYDADSAEGELDAFIRRMQEIASRYDGAVLQLTIGDKGSYAYINFGALISHEDDARRAVKTALELEKKTDLQLQMGITQGVMRVGAYGSVTRKTFGALGDDVNLAARLMTTATTGEIILSGHVHKAVRDNFTFEPRSPLAMKGKAEPLPVFAVTGESQKRAIRLQEPTYALPMVGRQSELKLIEEKLDLAAEGKSQVVAIVAEAGLGKSRLVAEVIRAARRKGFVGYGGACQSDSIHTPYQAWKSIWGAFFEVDHDMSLKKQMRFIEGEIEDRAPSRVDAMPLLNVVLDLNIPDNDFTKNLEPKIRQSALHALLEDCLKAAAGRGAVPAPNADGGEMTSPLLIVIEDLHWVDALSHDLLEGLAKALANYRMCFVLAFRPPSAVGVEQLQAPRLEALAQFTKIELHELTHAESTLAIRAKLAQLYPARGGALPSGLVDKLMARAQGNPFYLEELLNYVRDRGLDPADIENIELPDSLHTLILSRIDQLSEAEKNTLRVASIVGRLFRAKWLTGYYPELGAFPTVKASLDALESLDITPLDSPEPELAYLFKHIVTHEVTYESLPFATRAKLHEQLARYLENEIAVGAIHESPLLEALAFHYGRSDNTAKQMEYLRKAGEAAQKNFANDAALDFYGKLLPLLKDDKVKFDIHLKCGDVYQFIGNYDEAESDYLAALELAKDNAAFKASAEFAVGKLNGWRGEDALALDWLAWAKAGYMALEDTKGVAQVLIETGTVLWRMGKYSEAQEQLGHGLTLAHEAGDKLAKALALNNLGNVAHDQQNYTMARALHEESLTIRREMNYKPGIASSLGNLGNVANAQGNYSAARELYEECLVLMSETGEKVRIAMSFINLGRIAVIQGDYKVAILKYEKSLSLGYEMDLKWLISVSLNNLGQATQAQGNNTAARELYEESLALSRETGNKWGISASLSNLGSISLAQGDYVAARIFNEESLALARENGNKWLMAHILFGLGLTDLAENKPEAHEHILNSLHLRRETYEQLAQTSSLVGVAGLALHEGNAVGAAQWLGAVESALKALNAVMEGEMIPFHAQTLAAVKEKLGAAAFQSAWEEGGQWSLEEAVELALKE